MTFTTMTILDDVENCTEMLQDLSFGQFWALGGLIFSLQASKVEKAAPEPLPDHTLGKEIQERQKIYQRDNKSICNK